MKPSRNLVHTSFVLLLLLSMLLVACNGGGSSSNGSGGNGSSDPAATASDSGETTPDNQDGDTPSTDSTDQILRIGLRLWPLSLDPHKLSYTEEIAIATLNYEGLTRLDKDLKVVPAAAESWEYNDDMTSITFNLREDLTYSDGSPLVAQDFVNGIYRTLDSESPGYYQGTMSMIKGAEEVMDGEGSTEDLGISTPDDRTITIEFTKPTPFFHTLASLWVVFPVKQDLIEAGGEEWYLQAENHLGNGPFQITSIDDTAMTIEMAANENYWQGKPQLDGLKIIAIEEPSVLLQAYMNDEVDVAFPGSSNLDGIRENPELSNELLEFSSSCTEMYAFNTTVPPFDNKQVREAFAYAFDRESFIRDALGGARVKTLTWIPPKFPGYDAEETRYDFDPEKAKQLLAEAGYPDGEGLPPVTYTYDSTSASIRATVEYLVQMYQQNLGVTIQTEPVDGEVFWELIESIETYPQMVLDAWCADYPDPQNWISDYWHSESWMAQTRAYSNPDVDALIDQADVETDPDKRIELYQEAQRLVIGDVPMIIRSNHKNIFLVKPYVQGLRENVTPQDVEIPGSWTGLLNVRIEK